MDRGLRRIVMALLATAVAASSLGAEDVETRRGNIAAGGAFTCDFGLPERRLRSRAWSVIGGHDFAPLASHVVVRTEWWSVPVDNHRKLLADRLAALLEVARARGLAGVWALYNKQDRLVAFVHFGGRVAPPDPVVPDFASLAAVELAAPLGDLFNDQPWVKVFDRSHWALATWPPFAAGDTGEPSLWPNSPPFPLPHPGDGVCEVSRGENSTNAPTDCVATCGDGIVQANETNVSCPGDVPYF